MSYQDRWCTKADILKDLAEVNGGLGDVDEMFIVRGKKPPPARWDDDDDEIILRFGNLNGLENETPKPDLVGISAMLRMVDDYNRPDDDIGIAEMKPSEQIVISKLNPDVPEFVPKQITTDTKVVPNGSSSPKNKPVSISTDNLLNNNNNVSKSNLQNSKNSLDKLDESKSFKKSDVIVKVNNEVQSDNDNVINDKDLNCDIELKLESRIDISVLNPEEIKDIAQKLRCRISDAPKTGLNSKREKNVAIATLMRLNSVTPRASPKPESDADDTNGEFKAIKLFTPEYFEKRPPRTNSATGKIICELHGAIVDSSQASDSYKQGSNDKISKDNSENAKLSDDSFNTTKNSHSITSQPLDLASRSLKKEESLSPKLDAGQPIANKYAEATEVRNSIEKVNKWFDKPNSQKPRGPVVCLGPIAFKRKTPVTRSPASVADGSSISSRSSAAPEISQYRPSNYADELGKKFMERSKTMEKQKMDWWQKAELLMKEKEEAMTKTDQFSSNR